MEKEDKISIAIEDAILQTELDLKAIEKELTLFNNRKKVLTERLETLKMLKESRDYIEFNNF